MKQEKLCENEDMMPEELGAENVRIFMSNANRVGSEHYRKMEIQPWHAMEAWMPPEEFKGYLRGNALKYLARAGHKGPYKEDIQKAQHYLQKLLEIL